MNFKEFWIENKKLFYVIFVCLTAMSCLIYSLRQANIKEKQKNQVVIIPFNTNDGIQIGFSDPEFDFDVMYYKSENAIGIAGRVQDGTRVIINLDTLDQFRKDIEYTYEYFNRWKNDVDTWGIYEIHKEVCSFSSRGIAENYQISNSVPITFNFSKFTYLTEHWNNYKSRILKVFEVKYNHYIIMAVWEDKVVLLNNKVEYKDTKYLYKKFLSVLDTTYIKNCKNKILFNYQKIEEFNKVSQ